MTNTATLLLGLLLVGHFLGDFTSISTRQMLEAKRTGRSPGWIVVHAGAHGLLAGLAVFAVVRPAWPILLIAVLIEWSTHFAIDFARTRISVGSPRFSDMGDKPFWVLLGFDQMAHGLVLVWIAAYVL